MSATAPNTIVEARLRVLRAATRDGVAMSFAPLTHRSMVLVELETGDGRIGYGESWTNYPSWATVERVATLREGVFPLVIGQDSRHITELQRRLVAELTPIGRQWGAQGPIMQAISAVDIALWDLHGRASGRSIASLVGGRVRESSALYASSLGPEDVVRQARHCAAEGYTAVKVKLGFGREHDERILVEARGALGADVALYADANQAWGVDEAVAMAALLSEYDVAWLEEPLRGNRLDELEELHRRTGLVIATGENVYGREEFHRYAASPAVAILQPDIAKTGGFTEALAICQLAEAHRKPVLPHLYGGAIAFAATLQLAACAPAVHGIEYDIRDNPLRDPLLIDGPSPRQGRIALPDGCGLGVDLDLHAAQRHLHPAQQSEEELTA
ncbi:mandelate racemase/muconate lactonizing enzyme family protein [Saccharopolyspora sp. TS4A08]|uniref:Mandelate racemase/muconate lactonizing enzyme family protein n=1 Tax=Saccharopolyspora ipomoeae TaxID=3042027 RepID=A0ABT6PQH5_9PSEU|nr:mandelate racemase/muconate lactonizing enzyme family protein [Saccharopolyspora sp. TS4A08]MDI2030204.1 mandelate racemase/muconate lactonizing enzyme family protein [Saccharopolyspora sp. TS4A08]